MLVKGKKVFNSIAKVIPEAGRMAIFAHDELHEGGAIESGNKGERGEGRGERGEGGRREEGGIGREREREGERGF
jgi:hypothetical protein